MVGLKNIFDQKRVEFLRGEELHRLQRLYANYSNGIVRIHPSRCIMPSEYLPGAQKIFDIQVFHLYKEEKHPNFIYYFFRADPVTSCCARIPNAEQLGPKKSCGR